jgi:hypothetical protein
MPKARIMMARTYVRRQTVMSERRVRVVATPAIMGPLVGASESLVLYVQPIVAVTPMRETMGALAGYESTQRMARYLSFVGDSTLDRDLGCGGSLDLRPTAGEGGKIRDGLQGPGSPSDTKLRTMWFLENQSSRLRLALKPQRT